VAMLSVEEACALVLERVRPLEPEQVSLLDAVGRVLASEIRAGRALPPWDNSAMDGYAVRAAEAVTGACLTVTDEIPAGDAADRPLVPGTVARIFTGAPMPPGADSVVMQENTRRDGDLVEFVEGATLGRHVRRKGNDLMAGAVALPAGALIGPAEVGLLASLGRSQVPVHRAPTVAICTSGDELVEVDGGVPGPGQIVNGNSLALAAAVRQLGAQARIYPIIPDDRAATRAALEQASRADVILSTGGVSVGDYDFVGDTLRELAGGGFGFWKVAIKPGKPLAFGWIGDCAAFGLPGNPVSALVTFELFARPALRRMLGHPAVHRTPRKATTHTAMKAGGKRTEYRRARAWAAPWGLMVDADRTQSSGALSSAAGANALVVVPVDGPARKPGETVQVLLLSEDSV
jgi:molybdopterin molybdotransferase